MSLDQYDFNKKKGKIKDLFKKNISLFLVAFGLTFFISLSVLVSLGLVPKELNNNPTEGGSFSLETKSNTSIFGVDFTKSSEKVHKNSAISKDYLPARIVISSIGLDTNISNPESTNLEFLDNELTKSPVRYPGSGTIEFGNMFIFGHSTGFKIVQNKAYKVFNEIKNLKTGDTITVYSLSGKVYSYKVTGVKQAKKEETWIDFSSKEPSITLSTCDRLSQASDRYVVTAVLSL